MKPVPCFECLCMPMCKHKHWINFFTDCDLIWYYKFEWFLSSDFVESKPDGIDFVDVDNPEHSDFKFFYTYLTETKKIFEVKI